MKSALIKITSENVVDPSRSYRDLPFIQNGKWSPVRSGDYVADCATGRDYAQSVIDLIRDTQNPTIFRAVAQAITVADRGDDFYDGEHGVEVGFFERIAITLMV